jgi:hypothetical protein
MPRHLQHGSAAAAGTRHSQVSEQTVCCKQTAGRCKAWQSRQGAVLSPLRRLLLRRLLLMLHNSFSCGPSMARGAELQLYLPTRPAAVLLLWCFPCSKLTHTLSNWIARTTSSSGHAVAAARLAWRGCLP